MAKITNAQVLAGLTAAGLGLDLIGDWYNEWKTPDLSYWELLREMLDTTRNYYNSLDSALAAYNTYEPLNTNLKATDTGGYTTNQVLGSLGSSTLKGAATGFTLGSLVPGIGNVLGTAVGAGVGLIGGGVSNLIHLNKSANAATELSAANLASNLNKILGYQRNIYNLNNDQFRRMQLNGSVKAYGGWLPSYTEDFSNGVTFVREGGSHELNPLGGVPVSMAPDGTPNLVEEGEVIYNNYVDSDKLIVPKIFKKKYNIPDKYQTFAEVAEYLLKESEERPNDPISKRNLNKQLGELAMWLEQVKSKKSNNNNKYAFGGLEDIYSDLLYDLPAIDVKEKDLSKGYTYNNYMPGVIQSSPITLDAKKLYNYQNTIQNINNYKRARRVAPYAFDPFAINPYRRTDIQDVPIILESLERDMLLPSAGNQRDSILNKLNRLNPIQRVPIIQRSIERDIPLSSEISPVEEEIEIVNPYDIPETVIEAPRLRPIQDVPIIQEDLAGEEKSLPRKIWDVPIISEPLYNEEDETPLPKKVKEKPIKEKGNPSYYKWLGVRSAPIVGSALEYFTNLFGLTNTPDYRNADLIKRGISNIRDVVYSPTSTRMIYNPEDIYAEEAMDRANGLSALEAIANLSGGNAGTNRANVSNINFANQIGAGTKRLKGIQANRQHLADVLKFNLAAEQADAEGALKADMSNQSADYLRLAGWLAYAKAREDALDTSRRTRATTRDTFLTNLGSLGKEYATRDMINDAGIIDLLKQLIG